MVFGEWLWFLVLVCRIAHATQKQDAAGFIVADHVDKGLVGVEGGNVACPCEPYYHSGRGGGLRTFFIDFDKGLVQHIGNLQGFA